MAITIMYSFLINTFTYFLVQVQQFFSNLDPGYMDIIKIFAGSIGWIGGLTFYMWWREKHKLAAANAYGEKR